MKLDFTPTFGLCLVGLVTPLIHIYHTTRTTPDGGVTPFNLIMLAFYVIGPLMFLVSSFILIKNNKYNIFVIAGAFALYAYFFLTAKHF